MLLFIFVFFFIMLLYELFLTTMACWSFVVRKRSSLPFASHSSGQTSYMTLTRPLPANIPLPRPADTLTISPPLLDIPYIPFSFQRSTRPTLSLPTRPRTTRHDVPSLVPRRTSVRPSSPSPSCIFPFRGPLFLFTYYFPFNFNLVALF